jgi:thiol:disulfide interchange protein DsbD
MVSWNASALVIIILSAIAFCGGSASVYAKPADVTSASHHLIIAAADHASKGVESKPEDKPDAITGEVKQGSIQTTGTLEHDGLDSIIDALLSTLTAKHNFFVVFLAFWFLGVLLAFTPCVLPIIVIIAALLGGRTGEITRRNTILLTLTYVIAMSLTYAALGLFSFFFGAILQAYFQAPWIIISLSVLIAIFALSSIGFFQIKVPRLLQHFAASHTKFQASYGYIEVMIMGVIGPLIASPCVLAPVLAIFVYLSQYGSITISFFSLFFFGLGIGTPLLIATLIGVNILPEKGSWQHVLKIFFGLILLCAAVWISSRVIPSSLHTFLWGLILIYTATYIFALIPGESFNEPYTNLWRSIGIIIMAYGLALFLVPLVNMTGLVNNLLRDVTAVKTYPIFQTITNNTQLNAALIYAKQLKKPTAILFTADWCDSCKIFESTVLGDHTVQQNLLGFLILKVDLTTPNSQTNEIIKRYNIVGTPEIIFYTSSGKPSNQVVVGAVKLTEFESALKSVSAEK